MPYLLEKAQEVTADIIRQKLGRSLHARHLDAGSCNACDFEMGAMSNPIYDLHRYGVHFDASPRHADMLVVTGVVTRNLEQALKMSYEALPEPKLVMACGACAAAPFGSGTSVVPGRVVKSGCGPADWSVIQSPKPSFRTTAK